MRKYYTSLKQKLDLFMRSSHTMCLIDGVDQYSSPESCVSAYRNAIQRYNMPIKVHLTAGEVYIEKEL